MSIAARFTAIQPRLLPALERRVATQAQRLPVALRQRVASAHRSIRVRQHNDARSQFSQDDEYFDHLVNEAITASRS